MLKILAVALSMASLQSQVDIDKLAKALVSPDALTRISAAERMTAAVQENPDGLLNSAVQDRLIAALEAENDLVRRNAEAASRSEPLLFQEEYGEHYSYVLGLANRLRNVDTLPGPRRDRLLRALVLGTYNPGSPFAKELAREGERLVPYVLQAVSSTNGPTRWNGYAITASLFGASDAGILEARLAADSRQALQAAARNRLRDPAADVRVHAIDAVVAAKDRGALPLLDELAQKDPDARHPVFSVRPRAAAAAEALRRLP